MGPKCRICRREGVKLFLKGSRCLTSKCAMIRKNYVPGLRSARTQRSRLSEYGLHLREKQKLRRTYGLLEKQFRHYYTRAAKQRGVTGDFLFQILERRLDNVIYRASLASSRAQARQLVNHGFFTVNSKKVDRPSYEVKEGDKISLTSSAQKTKYFKSLQIPSKSAVSWLKVDPKSKDIEILGKPSSKEIEQSINMALIVEHYSRY